MAVCVQSVRSREAAAGELVRDGALPEWRLAWVVRGVGEYWREGRSVVLEPGVAWVREAGVREFIAWEDHEDARWVEAGFQLGAGEHRRFLAAGRAKVVACRVRDGDVLGPMLSWVWGHRTSAESRAMSAVVGAIVEVMLGGETGTVEAGGVVWPGVVQRAVAWMRARLAAEPGELFSNAQIAEAAGCSVPWIQFLFKRHFGWYPVQVARRARLDRAVELLRETELPVLGVARACGFVSGSHLSLQLRKYLGEDASGVRRLARAGKLKHVRLAGMLGELADGMRYGG